MARSQPIEATQVAKLLTPYVDEVFGCFTQVTLFSLNFGSDTDGDFLFVGGEVQLTPQTINIMKRLLPYTIGEMTLTGTSLHIWAMEVPVMGFKLCFRGGTADHLRHRILAIFTGSQGVV
jgi:hypothetical protein